MRERRLGFAAKVMGRDLKSHDTRRWQSGPSLGVSIEDLALFRLRDDLQRIGRADVLLAP